MKSEKEKAEAEEHRDERIEKTGQITPLLSSIFFAFQQTFFKTGCEKSFNFFTLLPWKTFFPPYLVAIFPLGHKPRGGAKVRLFLCIINYIIEYRRREIFVVY